MKSSWFCVIVLNECLWHSNMNLDWETPLPFPKTLSRIWNSKQWIISWCHWNSFTTLKNFSHFHKLNISTLLTWMFNLLTCQVFYFISWTKSMRKLPWVMSLALVYIVYILLWQRLVKISVTVFWKMLKLNSIFFYLSSQASKENYLEVLYSLFAPNNNMIPWDFISICIF